jgi:hypothetical protein
MTVFYIGARMGVSDVEKSCDHHGAFCMPRKNTTPEKYGKYRYSASPQVWNKKTLLGKKSTMTVFYIGERNGVFDAEKSCDPDGDFFTT